MRPRLRCLRDLACARAARYAAGTIDRAGVGSKVRQDGKARDANRLFAGKDRWRQIGRGETAEASGLRYKMAGREKGEGPYRKGGLPEISVRLLEELTPARAGCARRRRYAQYQNVAEGYGERPECGPNRGRRRTRQDRGLTQLAIAPCEIAEVIRKRKVDFLPGRLSPRELFENCDPAA